MLLTGNSILESIENGEISIEPFDKDFLGVNSYDVHLSPNLVIVSDECLDVYTQYNGTPIVIPPDGVVLYPGTLYLGVTMEFTSSPKYVPMLDGCSTLGRYGINIHQTAGFGDLGFSGHWTLEITVIKPTRVYPYMRIGQVSFEPVIGNTGVTYQELGRYNVKSSRNPAPKLALPERAVDPSIFGA